MKRLLIVLFIVLMLSPQLLFAQGEWTLFTNLNYVIDIAADGDYIWAASAVSGIARWNRKTGEYVKWTSQDNLPNGLTVVGTDVRSVAIGPDGRKWFGIWTNGVTVYDGSRWISYTTAQGLVNRRVNVVEVSPKGVAWMGTQGGVSAYNGTTWRSYTTKDSGFAGNIVQAITFDSSGNTWVGTTTGLTKIDSSGKLTAVDSLRGIRVNSILTDPEGRVWVATNGSSIFRYDGTKWQHKLPYPEDPGGFDGYISTLALSPGGDIWAGGWAVAVIDRNTISRKVQYNPNEQNGPTNGFQQKIVFDVEGNAWVCHGFQNAPIEKFNGTSWTSYKTADQLNRNTIFGLAVNSSSVLWIGEDGAGVQSYDGTNWKTYTTSDGLPSNSINDVSIDPQGNTWAATASGVGKYNGNTWTAYRKSNGLVNDWVEQIAFDSTGNAWFATQGGVSKFDGTTWHSYTVALDTGLGSDDVRAIAVDPRKTVWAGTYGKGASKFNGTSWTRYTTANGLVNNRVLSIAFDSLGNAWFGTEGGISRFDGTTWTSYTRQKNALLAGNIFELRFDANGILWAADGYGLNAFNGKDWFPFPAALLEQCLSLAIDKQGNKWVGTYTGLKKFVSPPITSAGLEVSQTVNSDTAEVKVSFGQTTVSLGFDSGSVSGKTVTIQGFGSTPPSTVFSGTLFSSAVGYYSITAPQITNFVATLSFTYTDSALARSGIAETALEVAFFDNAAAKWKALPTMVDTTKNIASATVNHFSLWALTNKTDKIISGVEPAQSAAVVNTYKLAQNYPNPFNPTTTIVYQLKQAGNMTLEIYNILGQQVKVLMHGNQPAGSYSITWDGRNNSGILVPSGIYFYRLKAGSFVQTRKMLFLK